MANQPATLTFEQIVRLMQRKTSPVLVDERLVCVCRLDKQRFEDTKTWKDKFIETNWMVFLLVASVLGCQWKAEEEINNNLAPSLFAMSAP